MNTKGGAVVSAEMEGDADLIVQVRGLDSNSIEFIQEAEKVLDAALLPLGFTRLSSTKGGPYAEFLYRQFAAKLP